MKVIETAIEAVKIFEPRVFGDDRGFFLESWNAKTFADLGYSLSFVQDNHSRSTQGTLRGLHYQVRQAQGKLVRVTAGAVLDVAVDLRRRSPSFGRHVAVVLSAENKRMLWVPPGFAHGFYVQTAVADFQYKCTDFYAPQFEQSLLWSDPALGIDWGISAETHPVLSAKDAQGLPLSQCKVFE